MTDTFLEVSADFESTRRAVIAAMIFPRDETLRAAYCLRNKWADKIDAAPEFRLSAGEIQALLSLPSRASLSELAVDGTKHGTVAGDLLNLIYEQWRLGKPGASLRGALKRYRGWAVGNTYGDATPLKYSDMQLRRYFEAATPSAHLWAALRLLKAFKDNGQSYKAAFTKEGMPTFLGVAAEIQSFATTFIPTATKPPKPVLDRRDLLLIPSLITPIKPTVEGALI